MQTVKKLQFIENVVGNIARRNDEWSHQVKNRIDSKDLMNANYHKNCSINFQNNKSIPLCHGVSVAKKVGRPQNESRNEAFIKLVELMESEVGHIYSIKDLVEFMQQECGEMDQIENRYLKKKLVEHFGVNLLVITNEGKPDLMVLR